METGLFDIYEAYFPWELKGSEYETLRVQSLKKLFLFINDFDICPMLINKSLAFHIWQSAMGNPPELKCDPKRKRGVALTFLKFLEMILKFAYLGFK